MVISTICILISIGRTHGQNVSFFGQGYYDCTHLKAENVDKRMVHKGTFEEGLSWKDKSGLNTVLLCHDEHPKQQSRDIYLYQYRISGDQCELVWDIQDFGGPGCKMTFVGTSLQLIDLDRDGIREVGFMYQNDCASDAPFTAKLMLLKGGEKLAIRGKFSQRDRVEIEQNLDPKIAQFPPIFKHFMEMNWDEFKSGDLEYAKSVLIHTDDCIVMQEEELFASGGTSFLLLNPDGTPMKLVPEMAEKIQWASGLELMADGKTLLYASLKGIGAFDPTNQTDDAYLTFLPTTEAISSLSWSPDGTKVAFTALNPTEYPLGTKIFVLTLSGNKMIKKDKFDAKLMYMAASSWVVEAPRFLDDHTLAYTEMVIDEEGPREGETKTISLK